MADVRLIDANAFIADLKDEAVNLYLNGLKGTPRDYKFLYDIADRVDEQPTIDAVPVVHGRWVREPRGIARCSYCDKGYRLTNGGANVLKFNYCPNCGAKMDGGAE